MKASLHIFGLACIVILGYPCFGHRLDASNPAERMLKQSPAFIVFESEHLTEYTSVLALRDGGFFIVWAGHPVDPDFPYLDIFGKIYNSDGSVRKSEIIINSIRNATQLSPALVQLPDDRILVLWNSYFDSNTMTKTHSPKTYRCIMNTDGIKEEEDLQIYEGDIVNFALLRDGRIASASYHSVILSDLALTRFNVTDTISTVQGVPNFVALDSGGFVMFLTMRGQNQDGNETLRLHAQFYDSNGQRGISFEVSPLYWSGHIFRASATMLPNGDILAVWLGKDLEEIDPVLSVEGIILAQDGTVRERLEVGFSGYRGFLPVVVSWNGEFLVSWYDDRESTTIYGRQYNADYTPKDTVTVLCTSGTPYKESFHGLFIASMNNGSFLVAGSFTDFKDKHPSKGIKAIVCTPEDNYERANPTRPNNSTTVDPVADLNNSSEGESLGSNDGLIIGISIACVLIIFIIYCVQTKLIRKKRGEKYQKLSLNDEGNPKDAEREKELKEEFQQANNENGTGIENQNPIQIVAPHDLDAQKLENISIIPAYNLRLINFVHPPDQNVPEQLDELNFAPGLDSQDARNFIMDGRLAKRFMNKSSQPPLNRSSSNEPQIPEAENLNEGAGLQFGPQLDSSAVRNYLLDGRLAKREILDMAGSAYQDQREKEEQPEEQKEQELSVENLSNAEKRERENKADCLNINNKENKEQQEIKEREEEPKINSKYFPEVEKREKEEDNLCIVCEAKPSTMVFLDCMHMCTCQTCSVALKSSTNLCPICREVIRDVKKVYVM